ncbi:MAG: tRNA lysidine(34) synthetase TilS [Wenzhouxiangellaceae bacterium]|nr:tRNA lysidine(34) synthetase TilS [Wenzhouxiangellaceae bacterium]
MKPRAGTLPEIDSKVINRSGLNWLAFSGGPDSLCLLDLLLAHGFRESLRVVHVDHGLDPQSAERAEQARQQARRLGIACRVERLDWQRLSRHGGPEAAARHGRYRCLQSLINQNDHVLTAHHADDQVETVMLRLLRGAGPAGLAGMQPVRPLEPGWLGRPLLHWTRRQILDYLDVRQLKYTIDPSNTDLSLDRNYLRHRVLPVVAERWPGYRGSILRSAQWMEPAAGAMDHRADADLLELLRPRPNNAEALLDLSAWMALETARAFAAIRCWCQDRSTKAPPIKRLETFRTQCSRHSADRQPTLEFDGAQLHAYRDRIWLDTEPLPGQPWNLDWGPADEIALPAGGTLAWHGPDRARFGRHWQVGSLRPGERLQLHTDGPSRKAAELLRESAIPPWRRNAIPCLRIDDRLRGIGTDWLDSEFNAWMKRHASSLRWHRRPAALLSCRLKS